MHLKSVTIDTENCPTKEQYPFTIPLLQQTKDITFASPVTFFVGENGTGKSTVLEALAHKCGVYIWRGMERKRFERNPYEADLYKFIALEWVDGIVPGSFFSAEIFQNFAQILDEWAAASPSILDYFGGKSLLTQSHGQSLMSFFKARYQIKGLYLLDEPETALSPRSQLDLVKLLKDMGQAGHAQFIIATHSPILLACPGATIYDFNAVPLNQIDYGDSEHYRVYKEFMEDRKKYL